MKKFSVLTLAVLVLLTFMVNPTSLNSKAKVEKERLEESGLDKAGVRSCKCLDYVKVFGSDIVNENSTNQYTAKAYFTDGSSQWVTQVATWSLESPVHSTLTQTGLLTIFEVEETGYCQITAFYTYNGTTKSGYKNVTVLPGGGGQWPPLL